MPKNTKMNLFIIQPINGLCNRLRAIASGWILSKQLNRTFKVYWETTPDIGGTKFTDLFEPMNWIINIEPIEWCLDDRKHNQPDTDICIYTAGRKTELSLLKDIYADTSQTIILQKTGGNYIPPGMSVSKFNTLKSEFYNSLKRVSVYSNQASNLVKLTLTGNQITISAQDIDFSISAYERLTCQYEGEDVEIGFKSTFLIEILANLSSTDVILELSDPTRAGILLPADSGTEDEDVLMLLMPMMINA